MEQTQNAGQETMSPIERMHALLTGQRPDRIPFDPFIFGFCARNVGFPVKTVYDDAEKSFWCQMWTSEMYGYDGGPRYGYASFGGWEFGGGIKMPESEWEAAPVVSRFPAQTPDEVELLEIPNVETAGSMPIAIKFARIQEQFGMPIGLPGAAPFTGAGNISEVDVLCRWLLKKPDTAHLLLSKMTQFLKNIVDYYTEKFSGHPLRPSTGEPSAANQIISPNQFEEFVLPYLMELHQYMLRKGLKNIFSHICGEQNLNLVHWAKLPYGEPGLLSFGHEVDLTRAIEVFGDQHIILGNVEPRVIQVGTGQEVYEATRQCIEKAKFAPTGYMLMAGCEVPVMAPPYNLYAMKKAIMDFGFYD